MELLSFVFYKPIYYLLYILINLITIIVVRFILTYLFVLYDNVVLFWEYLNWRKKPNNSNFIIYKRFKDYVVEKINFMLKDNNYKKSSGWLALLDDLLSHHLNTIGALIVIGMYISIIYYISIVLYMHGFFFYVKAAFLYRSVFWKDVFRLKSFDEFVSFFGSYLGISPKTLCLLGCFIFFVLFRALRLSYIQYFPKFVTIKYFEEVEIKWADYKYFRILIKNYNKELKFSLYFEKELFEHIKFYGEYLKLIFKSGLIFLDFMIISVKKFYIFVIHFVWHEQLKLLKISCKYWFRNYLIFWKPLFKRVSYFGYYRSNRSKWLWYK